MTRHEAIKVVKAIDTRQGLNVPWRAQKEEWDRAEWNVRHGVRLALEALAKAGLFSDGTDISAKLDAEGFTKNVR